MNNEFWKIGNKLLKEDFNGLTDEDIEKYLEERTIMQKNMVEKMSLYNFDS